MRAGVDFGVLVHDDETIYAVCQDETIGSTGRVVLLGPMEKLFRA